MPELTDHTKNRIFEKLDELKDDLHEKFGEMKDEVHKIDVRLGKVEQNQESHFKENDQQHIEMRATFIEVKDSLTNVSTRIDEVESVLDQRVGERKVFGSVWHLVIALIAGGGLLALGGITSKLLGIFGH